MMWGLLEDCGRYTGCASSIKKGNEQSIIQYRMI